MELYGPRHKVSSDRLVKPGIEPAIPGLQGKRFIHYTTAAPNICFGREIKKIVFQYALLSGGLVPLGNKMRKGVVLCNNYNLHWLASLRL